MYISEYIYLPTYIKLEDMEKICRTYLLGLLDLQMSEEVKKGDRDCAHSIVDWNKL